MMIAWASAGGVALWGLRRLAHLAILRGLRAPRLPHAQGPGEWGLPPDRVRELSIPGPRGRRLFGWCVMPAAASGEPVPAVLLMHGWGANAATMWPLVPPLQAAGHAVLLIDARCHGRSDDEAFSSMPRFAEDIAAGLAWLRCQPGIAGDRLSLVGHSVGAAAALLHAARQRDVQAVVSLSAFAHPKEVMRRFLAQQRVPYPVLGWYVLRHVQRVIGASFDEIAPLNTLPQVQCPVLLVHGRRDDTVPFTDAVRLRKVAPRARLLPVDADHDLRDSLEPHADVLLRFLAQAALAGHPSTDSTRNPSERIEHEHTLRLHP